MKQKAKGAKMTKQQERLATTVRLPSYMAKKYLTPEQVAEVYEIPENRLQKMRMLNKGPQFRRFGHRSILYSIEAIEHWIAQQPSGGDTP
jgi:hypothetical protein